MVQLSSYSIPLEGIQHTEENVQATVESSALGSGTLYITESFVLWLNQGQEGIQLEYKLISLHAISRDLHAFPKEHLLLHYDAKLPNADQDSGAESGEDEDGGSDVSLTELRFAPENSGSLETMFSALAHCQTLHPDSDCQLSDDEFQDAEGDGVGDGYFQNEDGFAYLNEEGRANLERMNQMLLGGQGDADLASRTQQLTLTNGHASDQEGMEQQEGQFQDADDMDNQ
ncbi:methylosome subunit pICln [Aplysia californica]|uniref:Methylosome subunit pICln n=1 Tax=Aplysia californica TaxID=6500 RepID=A0ABM0K4U4_APLCA|nr:methylosome subunit pICln [Aplysia californica]